MITRYPHLTLKYSPESRRKHPEQIEVRFEDALIHYKQANEQVHTHSFFWDAGGVVIVAHKTNSDCETLLSNYDWSTTRSKYALCRLLPGIFVYALKEQFWGESHIHIICANCYKRRAKSPLQLEQTSDGIRQIRCLQCHFSAKSRKA